MAVKFMVLGGPRSGTTWAANWLTTNQTFCLHDPLMEYPIAHLENMMIPGRRLGISCTSSLLYPNWVLKHPAPKILLYREIEEINLSLGALGLLPLNKKAHYERLLAATTAGIKIWEWKDLFSLKTALDMWTTLLPDIPFDAHRHEMLCGMNIQPQLNKLPVSKEALGELVQRCKETLI